MPALPPLLPPHPETPILTGRATRTEKTRRKTRRKKPSPQRDADSPPSLPAVGLDALTARSVARIVQSRAALVGFRSGDFGGHSLKHSELTTGMQAGAHAAQLKRLGRHKSFAVVGE